MAQEQTYLSRFIAPIALSVVLALTGCDTSGVKYGDRDVSNDPTYGNFSAVVGTWKSKVPLYLVKTYDKESPLLITPDGGAYVPNDNGLAVLPVGTEIRIEHLIRVYTWQTTFFRTTGSLVTGPYARKGVQLHWKLFVNNGIIGSEDGPFPIGKQGWSVAPEILGE